MVSLVALLMDKLYSCYLELSQVTTDRSGGECKVSDLKAGEVWLRSRMSVWRQLLSVTD